MMNDALLRNCPSADYVNETNGLIDGHAYHSNVDHSEYINLAELARRGGRITRLRILSDHGMADISYVHGTLPNGQVVALTADWPMCFRLRETKKELIAWAREHRVFAKSIGLLDEVNWSVLR